jgi:hypothetical protein
MKLSIILIGSAGFSHQIARPPRISNCRRL